MAQELLNRWTNSKWPTDGWNYKRFNNSLVWPTIVLSLFFPCRNFCAENCVIFFYEIKLLFTLLAFKKNVLYLVIKCSNFQEAIQSTNLHTFINKQINVIFITSSVRITWLKFIHVQAEVMLMAVQYINVESFFSLRKFNGPMFLHRSAKNMAAKFKGRAKNKYCPSFGHCT